MKTRTCLALTLALGIAFPMLTTPAIVAEPSTLAPAPVAAAKYVVHVDGMT